MNFGALMKAFDAVLAVSDVARRMRGPGAGLVSGASGQASSAIAQGASGLAGQVEARLSNVVVAALKEAFDRDHARLEIEREHLEEQRRRAEEAMRLELRRQAAEREMGRLRLLVGTALLGWVASAIIVGWRLPLASMPERVTLGLGWLLLLASLASAFALMGRINVSSNDGLSAATAEPRPNAPLWLLIAGLALTTITMLL